THRPAEQVRLFLPFPSRSDPCKDMGKVLRCTLRTQPAATVAGCAAITAKIHREYRISSLNQAIHQRQVLALDLQVKIGNGAPGSSMHQQNGFVRSGGGFLPQRDGMTIDRDCVPDAFGRIGRNRRKQPGDGEEDREWYRATLSDFQNAISAGTTQKDAGA